MDRRSFLKTGAGAVAGLALGLSRPGAAEMTSCDFRISGDVAGTVPHGEMWEIGGDVNLTGDLVVEGLLVGSGAFTIEGNGHQIVGQHGGRVNLAGIEKTGWCWWGDAPVGWQVGDRLAVAPTKFGDHDPTEVIWQGSWAATVRPSNSADVPLPDGTCARPEVANLSQSIRLNNLSRIMFHHGAGVQSFANVNVRDSGIFDTVDFYPIHFHHNDDTTRGSMFTDVIVEDSAFRAFVPHSSNGITFNSCVSVRGTDDSFWWNPTHETHDITYDRCLVLGQDRVPRGAGFSHSGFRLGRGTGNVATGCVAVGVRSTTAGAGILWPEADSGDWHTAGLIAHNNTATGAIHYAVNGDVDGIVGYRNGRAGFAQLTYVNHAAITRIVLAENGREFEAVGVTRLGETPVGAFGVVAMDGPFRIGSSPATAGEFIEVTGHPSSVLVDGAASNTSNPQRGRLLWRFTDTGLTPADFDMVRDGGPESVFSIVEGGVEAHRYENNAWVD